MGAERTQQGRAPRPEAEGPCRGGQGQERAAKMKNPIASYAFRGKKGVNDTVAVCEEKTVLDSQRQQMTHARRTEGHSRHSDRPPPPDAGAAAGCDRPSAGNDP